MASGNEVNDGRNEKIPQGEPRERFHRLRERRGAIELKSDGGQRLGDYTIVDGAWVLWADTLTKKELSEIKSAFARYDRGGKGLKGNSKIGTISTREAGKVLKELVYDPSLDEIHDIIVETDPTNSGFIEYPRFVQAMAKRRKNSADDLHLAFKALDQSGDGLISAEELQSCIVSAGEDSITPDEIQELLGEIDIDGDGYVDYQEFIEVFKQ